METEKIGDISEGAGEIGGGEQCPACSTYSYATDRYCACCGRRIRLRCGSCGSLVFASAGDPCPLCAQPLAD